MPSSDDVIEAIFAAAAEDEATAEIATPLAQLWRAGDWEAERIVAVLSEVITEH